MEQYVVINKGMDAASSKNLQFQNDPKFKSLNAKLERNSGYTVRELIYIMRNEMKNSSGAEETEKRMIMGLLCGRTPESIKNTAK